MVYYMYYWAILVFIAIYIFPLQIPLFYTCLILNNYIVTRESFGNVCVQVTLRQILVCFFLWTLNSTKYKSM